MHAGRRKAARLPAAHPLSLASSTLHGPKEFHGAVAPARVGGTGGEADVCCITLAHNTFSYRNHVTDNGYSLLYTTEAILAHDLAKIRWKEKERNSRKTNLGHVTLEAGSKRKCDLS